MPEIYKERIIKILKHADYEPVKLAGLARTLSIDPQDYPQFKQAFDQLRSAGHVIIGSGNVVTLPSLTGKIVGRFRANPKGFGFIIPLEPNSHGDLFIPPGAGSDAMTGDIVKAKVVKETRRGAQTRYCGQVVEILERAENRFVGTLTKHDEGWLVQPEGSTFVEPVAVDDVSAKGAKQKDKVVVEILSYPTEKFLARGAIIEVLGRAGSYETEILSVVRRFHLPTDFDSECLDQARSAALSYNPDKATDREDITKKTTITIDPPDAKDFDDAITLEKTSNGNFELGVHIADVSHFIEVDSPLDIEARKRGNSTYLPGRTIPMLPEVLSNGVCSLQPDQKRFVKSAYITYDSTGKVVSRRFANSLIKSTRRLTYRQADKILKGSTKDTPRKVIDLLKNMERLARIIEVRRIDNGMLHLDLPETELIMDKSGQVTDAKPADTSYPHTMIEMFMVEANEAVAALLDRLDIPFLRRVHPEPDTLTLKNLSKLVGSFGLSLPRTPSRKSIQDLLASVEGTDCSLPVSFAVLRSFEKARYAPMHIGHYALASTHYGHFTSPIRRYADLTIHRAIQLYLEKRTDQAKQIAAAQDLNEIGSHITFTGQRSANAERELTTMLVLQLLGKRLGQKLHCVITGLTNFGVFVQSRKFGVEGLVTLTQLGPDKWKYDARTQCIIGEISGHTLRLGRPMDVTITSVNLPARQLNLTPVEPVVTAEEIRNATPKSGGSRRERPRNQKPTRKTAAKSRPRKKKSSPKTAAKSGPAKKSRNTAKRRSKKR